MKKLGIDIVDEKEVIEFDLLGLYNTIGIIIEDTSEKEGNTAKIKRFKQKCDYFIKAFENRTLNFKVFKKIPGSAITKFKKVKKWKSIYIGISDELIKKKISEKKIPNSKDLVVLNKEHLDYLDFLRKRTNGYAKLELLERLGERIHFGSPDLEKKVTAIQLENKKILGRIDANVFIFQLSAEELLNTTRVPRYGSLKPWMPEFGSEDYQRILSQNKIEKLAKIINTSKELTSFPNALTVVLSNDVKVSNPQITNEPDLRKLIIPYSYGVMNIIDGQHRLFGFAKSKLSPKQKLNTKLIVIGIKFNTKTVGELRIRAARTFVDINREQTKVPTELTYWLGYSTLGETKPEYLATKVLINLETNRQSNLKELFHTRPFQKKNRIGGKPIKIVTVADELSKLFDFEKLKLDENKKLLKLFSQESQKALKKQRKSNKIIDEAYQFVNDYFGIVSTVFPNDWKSKESLIFSTKYITGFIRLFIEYKRMEYSNKKIASKLRKINSKVKSYLKKHGEDPSKLKTNPVVFWRDYESIPSLKDHVTTVVDFMTKIGL